MEQGRCRHGAIGFDHCGAHRYGFPRTDLNVTLDGVAIKPALALGGWVVFKPMGEYAMVMGDLVLLETEINPVMSKLLEAGLDITALHNHLLRAAPATFYMHVGGQVNPVIRELRSNGIEVTAIHSHMLTEQPRLIFLHFWANDDAL